MRKFFYPESVAVLGASSRPGKIGYEIVRSLVDSKFKGQVHPIQREGKTVCGLAGLRSVLDVEGDVDLAVVSLPARDVPAAIEDCGGKGIGRVVIISGGFKEIGEEGERLQGAALDAARRHGIRIIGPNCVGLYNSENGLDTFFQPRSAMERPGRGNVAFLSQSGTYGLSLMEWLAEEGLGVSKFVSWGNRSDVDEIEMLEYLEDDDSTEVVAIYLEGTDDGRELARAVERMARKKPVVILKAGRSEAGGEAARSHTASMAGDFAVFKSVMEAAGAVVVEDLEEMLDLVKFFSIRRSVVGDRVVFVTNGAGPAIIALDAMEGTCLESAELDGTTVGALRERLPDYCTIDNPLDLTGSATAAWYIDAMKLLERDDGWDICIILFAMQDSPIASTVYELETYLHSSRKERTYLAIAAGGGFTKRMGHRVQHRGVPFYPTSTRAVKALENARRRWNWLEIQKGKERTDTKTFALPEMGEGGAMDEIEAKELLRGCGIAVPDSWIVEGEGELPEGIRYPVAVKAAVRGLLHKTEEGAVALNIQGRDELERTLEGMRARHPGARLLVEEMVTDGLEFIVGVTRDASFGQVIMTGLGGTFTELYRDVSFATIPVSRSEACAMLERLKAREVLGGFRGLELDREALLKVLMNTSALAAALGERLEQLELNPVLVQSKGAVALDAKIVLK